MKNLLLSISVLSILAGCATAAIEERTYRQVVLLAGMNKHSIYIKSQLWLSHAFESAKAVKEFDSEAEGIITGNIMLHHGTGWYIKYKITIEFKDGRSRLTGVATEYTNGKNTYPIVSGYYNNSAKELFDELIRNYEAFVRGSAKKNDSW